MDMSCPKCSQPIRIGAKYCGFCGTSLSTSTHTDSNQAGQNNSACPHCNAPLRPGIKYCANCGKLVPTAQAVTPAQFPVIPASETFSDREIRLTYRRKRLLVSLGVLLFVCLIVATSATIFGRPLIKQLFSQATPTHTPTHTAISVPTNTPTALPTATLLPSATPTELPTPTNTRIPSATPTRLMPPTSTPTSIPVLLVDEFDQPLDINWETWGTPNLSLENTNTTQGLLIKASDVDSGGISSLNNQITLIPGLFISFTADIDYLDEPMAEFRVAWSPGTSTPPEITDGLPLVLLIDSRKLTVQVENEDGALISCPYPVEDTAHTYLVEIGRDLLPSIFVDGNLICQDILPPLPQFSQPGGRIHISGRGLIDDIKVSFIPQE